MLDGRDVVYLVTERPPLVVARDHAGRAEAAVTLTFVAAEHDQDDRAHLAERAAEAATELTGRLGG